MEFKNGKPSGKIEGEITKLGEKYGLVTEINNQKYALLLKLEKI